MRALGGRTAAKRSVTRPSTSRPARRAGATCSPGSRAPNPGRGALLLHGHLDVVPAEASDWSVHPFSGAIEDGYVWGRGAVDMKDMCGMLIAVARHFKRAGIVPPRDLVFAFVSDEEARREVRLRSGWSTTDPTCSTASPRRSARSAAFR